MPKREDNFDEFWDIGELLPKRTVHPQPFPHSSVDAVTVVVGKTPDENTGIPIPKREERPRTARAQAREYALQGSFIERVRILPWPSDFNFYRKFRSDALRYFDRTHEACEYVYFFSYMPQYEQMTSSQMAYYLYWREEVRAGRYIRTDNSYLFLLFYEIINLPDKIAPATGALLLSKLWCAYRSDFRYLDKYIGEWLCDYCLIYGVEPCRKSLAEIADSLPGRIPMPEFYFERNRVPFSFLMTLSSYDFRKSKYYAELREAFETHIPASVESVMNGTVFPSLASYGIHPMKMTRDSFSGAVASRAVKFKIELTVYSLRRSYELKQLVTNLIKLCENHIRAAFSIKSRFSPSGLDEQIGKSVSAYFDRFYPDRFLRRRTRAAEEEEAAYMALYEPAHTGPADIGRALEIENEAWETAELLDAGEEASEEAFPDHQPAQEAVLSADGGPSGDFDDIVSALNVFLREALSHIPDGGFAAFCRENNRMPETVRASINEIAADQIGDILIEEDGTLIEDYKDDILAALRRAAGGI